MFNSQYWIEKLEMNKHPEGGYYRETYRCLEVISSNSLPERYTGDRNISTAIYFLIPEGDFSAFHRLKTDEIWHFYTGSSLTLHLIDLEGKYSRVKLGSNYPEEEYFQIVVKAGNWFGATLNNPESFALIGCTVSPGFDPEDFELGKRQELINLYPEHRSIITHLTRS